jgi:hypothetical protein
MPAIAVPIRPPRPVKLMGVKVLGGEGFPPPAVAALVRTTDDVPEDLVLLSLEAPTACSLPAGVDKKRLEGFHAERLLSDVMRQDFEADWHLVGPGADPPDFRVRISGEEIGL